MWGCTLQPVFLRPSPGAQGTRRPLGGSASCRGRLGFPAQSSDSQRSRLGRLGSRARPGLCSLGQRQNRLFSPSNADKGVRWLAHGVSLPAGSLARRCRLFICGFDVCVFSPRTGQGHGWAGTESKKQKTSIGEEDREAGREERAFLHC